MVGIMLIYALIIMGGTYAYLYVSGNNTNTLAGDLGAANVELTVERVVPETDMPLVPLLDAALGNAIQGNGGVSARIDSNHNLSCEVYQIKVYNPSTINLQLSGTVTLVASGEDNIYNNLKWELLENQNTRRFEYTINGMETSILDRNVYLEAHTTKIYYIAVWISETGIDQRETDRGTYGGIVDFSSYSGGGITATFGTFDKDYCTNNRITKLGDCMLISEKYSNSVDSAKEYIASKGSPTTSQIAPTVTYEEISAEVNNSNGVISTTAHFTLGKGYTFDTSTGQFTLTNYSNTELTDDYINYYTCGNTASTLSTCATLYQIKAYTKTGTTYKVTSAVKHSYNTISSYLSENGLYAVLDDEGTSYIYRGNVKNNYVSYAGFIWRIVRQNGDGSIRMIYSGTSTSDTGSSAQIGTSQYNSKYYDPTYVGYKYHEDFALNETNTTSTTYTNLTDSAVYYCGTSYEFDEATKKFKLAGDLISGTWKEKYTEVINNYPYSCLSMSSTGTCNFIVKFLNYVNSYSATINYISYSSKDYASTLLNTTDSTIKGKVDKWYESNIKGKQDDYGNLYSNYLVDEVFCNDRSINSGSGYLMIPTTTYGAYGRNASKRIPSLSCTQDSDKFSVSNGTLTYPIALLTIDEVTLAGGVFGNVNTQYYLYTGATYWTMSSYDFYANNTYDSVWRVYSNGDLGAGWTTGTYGVRPVINLRSDIKITEGNGTASFPYVVTLLAP